MRTKSTSFSSSTMVVLLLFFLCFHNLMSYSEAQPGTLGFQCSPAQAVYPCQTYIHFRATIPDYVDLAAVGDLFSVSRRMIATPSKISLSEVSSVLPPAQSLFVPITCGCHFINDTYGNFSYAAMNYSLLPSDTYWFVSTSYYQNLTSYQSVEVVNPDMVPTQMTVGDTLLFPIFCKCPNSTANHHHLITYIFHPEDNLTSLASRFGTTPQAIVDVNGHNISSFDTVFIPVSQIPLD